MVGTHYSHTQNFLQFFLLCLQDKKKYPLNKKLVHCKSYTCLHVHTPFTVHRICNLHVVIIKKWCKKIFWNFANFSCKLWKIRKCMHIWMGISCISVHWYVHILATFIVLIKFLVDSRVCYPLIIYTGSCDEFVKLFARSSRLCHQKKTFNKALTWCEKFWLSSILQHLKFVYYKIGNLLFVIFENPLTLKP